MEYKSNYIPLYKYLLDKELFSEMQVKENITLILDNIFKILNDIHCIETININKTIFFNDIKKEIYDKVITRKKNIEEILNYFGEIQYVNDVKILSFEVILEKCKTIITSYYTTLDIFEYNIIFGDCNFSNILIDKDNINNITFIDPRGYFGDTSIYGLKEYDYSKILYAISGYDNFNSNFFNIDNINITNINIPNMNHSFNLDSSLFSKVLTKENTTKSIKFNIKPIQIDKKYIDKYFNKVHKAFMVIHWLSLADYNKNNIWKCISSYYYGLYLGTLL